MARIRTIKPSFFTSEDITALPPLARLLFVGLFTECDRDGRVEDRPKTLKTRLLPEDDVDVDDLLWRLVDGGLIRRYEAHGVHVIQVLKFDKHQKPHPKEGGSILASDGADRQKPNLNTASREKVFTHPVENPSSPARKGREGDLGSGDLGSGDLECGVPDPTPTHGQGVQSRGAFEPGSLPRDHLRHSLCGAAMRLCLSEHVYGKFVGRYGGPAPAARQALQRFVDALEQAQQSIGNFLWLEDHFTAFLRAEGRLTDASRDARPVPENARHAQKLRDIRDGKFTQNGKPIRG